MTTELDMLTVALTLVPHLLPRNRMPGLYKQPVVPRAKRRAQALRTAFRDLSVLLRSDDKGTIAWAKDCDAELTISYTLTRLGYSRSIRVTIAEASVLTSMLVKADCPAPPWPHDETAVARCMDAFRHGPFSPP